MGIGGVGPKGTQGNDYTAGAVSKMPFTAKKGGPDKKSQTKIEKNIAPVQMRLATICKQIIAASQKTTFSGSKLSSRTDGVGKFFSGSASLYPKLYSSISSADEELR
jgi:hypothetical protein